MDMSICLTVIDDKSDSFNIVETTLQGSAIRTGMQQYDTVIHYVNINYFRISNRSTQKQ